MFEPVDIANISEVDLTRKEKETINLIRNDGKDSEDLIIENGYTAPIHEEDIDGIINSVKVSFLNKRILYMKEFGKGLNSYRILDIISDFPDLLEKLFILNNDKKPDANYLFSCISPQLSEPGSLRRHKEENIIDMLQDIFFKFEEGSIRPYDTAVADKRFDEKGEDNVQFATPDISIPGLMKWLIGQEHKPLCQSEEIRISLVFDHDCMKRNPHHSICFPIVGACGSELSIPVSHIENNDQFCEIFSIAYCKGNAFGRH